MHLAKHTHAEGGEEEVSALNPKKYVGILFPKIMCIEQPIRTPSSGIAIVCAANVPPSPSPIETKHINIIPWRSSPIL